MTYASLGSNIFPSKNYNLFEFNCFCCEFI